MSITPEFQIFRIFVQHFVYEVSVYLGFASQRKDNKLRSTYRNIKSQNDS